ncbi:MAG: DUF1848 domain-containing protein [Desulfovibrio sp.]|jgi:hypothetical protein|nr:DUF1848 domain-containing protein [Desulfovibrio sp.]
MIITASRRTDIPAFYSAWFLNRLKDGYALAPNPRNSQQLGRVELSPRIVDCIVFWSKNPAPMLDRFREIENLGYPFIVHFTLTPYGNEIESGLPPKKIILKTFIELAGRIGPQRVIWRYDPIIVDGRFSAMWHAEQFAALCEILHPYAHRCVVSFVDPYKSIAKFFRGVTHEEMRSVAAGLSRVADEYGIALSTCAEKIDLDEFGIGRGACVDKKHIEQVIGSRLDVKTDANQREMCLCAEAVDLGAYDTCPHGCMYCYAVSSPETAAHGLAAHRPSAPMLTGYPTGAEIVTDRTKGSRKATELCLYI